MVKNCQYHTFDSIMSMNKDNAKNSNNSTGGRNTNKEQSDSMISSESQHENHFENRHKNQKESLIESDDGRGKWAICWLSLPDRPLSVSWFFSIRGSENFHLYLWLVKDLAWAQSWYYCGNIVGSLAVIWGGFILYHAMLERNTNEIFTGVAQFFWYVCLCICIFV